MFGLSQVWGSHLGLSSSFKNLFIAFIGRGREREKHSFGVSLIYAFIGWFLYVLCLGIEPTTLGYWDDTLANCPGLSHSLLPP